MIRHICIRHTFIFVIITMQLYRSSAYTTLIKHTLYIVPVVFLNFVLHLVIWSLNCKIKNINYSWFPVGLSVAAAVNCCWLLWMQRKVNMKEQTKMNVFRSFTSVKVLIPQCTNTLLHSGSYINKVVPVLSSAHAGHVQAPQFIFAPVPPGRHMF